MQCLHHTHITTTSQHGVKSAKCGAVTTGRRKRERGGEGGGEHGGRAGAGRKGHTFCLLALLTNGVIDHASLSRRSRSTGGSKGGGGRRVSVALPLVLQNANLPSYPTKFATNWPIDKTGPALKGIGPSPSPFLIPPPHLVFDGNRPAERSSRI